MYSVKGVFMSHPANATHQSNGPHMLYLCFSLASNRVQQGGKKGLCAILVSGMTFSGRTM